MTRKHFLGQDNIKLIKPKKKGEERLSVEQHPERHDPANDHGEEEAEEEGGEEEEEEEHEHEEGFQQASTFVGGGPHVGDDRCC